MATKKELQATAAVSEPTRPVDLELTLAELTARVNVLAGMVDRVREESALDREQAQTVTTLTAVNEGPVELPDEKYQELLVPLPPEAITSHPTKDFLSSIKTIYMVERLNNVFGLGGWDYTTEVIENYPDKPMIVVRVTLTVPRYGIRKEAFGGNNNVDRGDAYKGAVTDALSKISGYLGIGMDVYKGFGPTTKNGGRAIPPRSQQKTSVAAAPVSASEPVPPCGDCNGPIKTIIVGDDPYSPQDLIANSLKQPYCEGKKLCAPCQKKRKEAWRSGWRPGNAGPLAAAPVVQAPVVPAPVVQAPPAQTPPQVQPPPAQTPPVVQPPANGVASSAPKPIR